GRTSIDPSEAGYKAIARDNLLVHPKLPAAMFHQFVELFETALVQQQFHAFTRGQLALAMLTLAALRSPALLRFSMAATQLFEAIHKPEGTVPMPYRRAVRARNTGTS